ncbi:hypothetical protein CAPTEDRAFT_193230 [Capitella teleta]|uniref:Ig-like domain-containing protein n=1 Tax=Capitella teleta TaxID=283909 RepID=R7UPB3_CAPTE|nr:hypothetical protein CAPTEDRAFT_193230 [Capitella teleta]|eukprot:ELU05782.1 hypothetical protein CAPTEDRAFT_193230 [Capitella teleta]
MHLRQMFIVLVLSVITSFVSDLPEVLAMPVSLYLPKGMLGRIECPILANPPVTQVAWSKNEQPIDFLHTSRLKRTNQGLLVFKTVMASDEGRYTCTPCSPQGCGKPSNVVKVMVRGHVTHAIL